MTDTFENSQIDFDSIPQADHILLKPIEKTYLKINVLGNLFFFLVIMSVLVLFAEGIVKEDTAMSSPIKYFPYSVVLILAILAILIPILGFKWKAYAIREKDIIYRQGLIFRKWTHIPFNRVQHAEITQGILDRYFGLAKLKIYTAGGSNSDLVIPGLTFEDAEKLKSFVLKKSAQDDIDEI